MRPGPNSRRLRGRGSGGRRGGPGRPQNFESNGPDVKVRGSAQQVVEKYLSLAREAATAGNPVMAENYYQHAEHHFRIQNINNAGNQNGNGRDQPPYEAHRPANGSDGATNSGPQPVIEAAVETPPEPAAEAAPAAESEDAPEQPAPRRRRPRTRDSGPVTEPVEQSS